MAWGSGTRKNEGARKSPSLLLDLAPWCSVALERKTFGSPSQAGCRRFDPGCPLQCFQHCIRRTCTSAYGLRGGDSERELWANRNAMALSLRAAGIGPGRVSCHAGRGSSSGLALRRETSTANPVLPSQIGALLYRFATPRSREYASCSVPALRGGRPTLSDSRS